MRITEMNCMMSAEYVAALNPFVFFRCDCQRDVDCGRVLLQISVVWFTGRHFQTVNSMFWQLYKSFLPSAAILYRSPFRIMFFWGFLWRHHITEYAFGQSATPDRLGRRTEHIVSKNNHFCRTNKRNFYLPPLSPRTSVASTNRTDQTNEQW